MGGLGRPGDRLGSCSLLHGYLHLVAGIMPFSSWSLSPNLHLVSRDMVLSNCLVIHKHFTPIIRTCSKRYRIATVRGLMEAIANKQRKAVAIGDCSCVISFDCCPPARHTSSSTVCLPFLVQDRGLPLLSHVSKIALHGDAGARLEQFCPSSRE